MHLSFFTDEAYNKLYNEVDDNLDRYKSGESWVNDFFEGRAFSQIHSAFSLFYRFHTPYITIVTSKNQFKFWLKQIKFE